MIIIYFLDILDILDMSKPKIFGVNVQVSTAPPPHSYKNIELDSQCTRSLCLVHIPEPDCQGVRLFTSRIFCLRLFTSLPFTPPILFYDFLPRSCVPCDLCPTFYPVQLFSTNFNMWLLPATRLLGDVYCHFPDCNSHELVIN